MKRALPLFAALLAAPAFWLLAPAPAAAQMDTSKSEQTFDYNAAPAEMKKIKKFAVETTYDDAEIINDPIYGTLVLSKHRWRSWVARAIYLTLVNIALLVIILSLSRTEEHNIIIGYVLSGISETLSFWVFLCAVLIFNLKAAAWIYLVPVSAATAAAGYAVLMKIKKSDISLSELKESFQKMRAAASEDPRLSSVSGAPGNWPDEDFLK